ncbi:hypothetical protein [Nocardia asiatica]|uniref:hypothetical protein n=1 Tax=Nocardia asiatica TaxID=209252 RepID=UPI0002F2FFCF|nr:hypothetical protein [Nocardia asiatica]
MTEPNFELSFLETSAREADAEGRTLVIDPGYVLEALEKLAEARARITELEAQLDRVREVHLPIEALNMRHHPRGQLTRVCSGCGTDNGNWQMYPCPTIRALREVQP